MPITIETIPTGLIQANAYIVQAEGRDDCVVIDPGDEYEKLRQAIGARRVGAILLTHGHFDHVMAAAPLAAVFAAPAYLHAGDMEMLGDAALNGYRNLMGDADMAAPAVAAEPFGQALSVAGLDFTVLHTPGHSKGSVCLYLQGEGALFSGDTLFRMGYGRLDLHGGNTADMIRSLKALFALPAGTKVYPGHGEATTIGEERARYRL